MGTYEIIEVPCPECGENEHAQSKSGPCEMRHYTLEDCPPEVMLDINRHAPFECPKCGTRFYVDFALAPMKIKYYKVVKED